MGLQWSAVDFFQRAREGEADAPRASLYLKGLTANSDRDHESDSESESEDEGERVRASRSLQTAVQEAGGLRERRREWRS